MKRIILVMAILTACINLCSQNVAVRTSLTMLATGTPNIEVSIPVKKRLSIHLPVAYNPWKYKENSRFQQLTVMPGIRLWKQNCGVHYFYSIYGIATRFHSGGWFDKKFRYDGTGYGAGAGFGYSHVLNDHWNLDFEVGAGLIWADYDKCGWQSDSHLYKSVSALRLIPTKLDIALIYYF